jgi:hypothetical protein
MNYLYFFLLLNALAYYMMYNDKQRAKRKEWRHEGSDFSQVRALAIPYWRAVDYACANGFGVFLLEIKFLGEEVKK